MAKHIKSRYMIKASQLKPIIVIALIMLSINFSNNALAKCSDLDSIAATDTAALKFFKRAKLFEIGKVLKQHQPSRRKETASYIKYKDSYYTFFGLVEPNCRVKIIKRTHARG